MSLGCESEILCIAIYCPSVFLLHALFECLSANAPPPPFNFWRKISSLSHRIISHYTLQENIFPIFLYYLCVFVQSLFLRDSNCIIPWNSTSKKKSFMSWISRFKFVKLYKDFFTWIRKCSIWPVLFYKKVTSCWIFLWKVHSLVLTRYLVIQRLTAQHCFFKKIQDKVRNFYEEVESRVSWWHWMIPWCVCMFSLWFWSWSLNMK